MLVPGEFSRYDLEVVVDALEDETIGFGGNRELSFDSVKWKLLLP